MNKNMLFKTESSYLKAHSRFAPSQWKTALLSNDVSHWLGASIESALYLPARTTAGRTITGPSIPWMIVKYFVKIRWHLKCPYRMYTDLNFCGISGGTMLMTIFTLLTLKFLRNPLIPYQVCGPDGVIQNGWRDIGKSHGTSNVNMMKSPVTGEFPSQRPVTRSLEVFFDLRLNKRVSKQSWGWRFETSSCSLWRHSNGYHNWWG